MNEGIDGRGQSTMLGWPLLFVEKRMNVELFPEKCLFELSKI